MPTVTERDRSILTRVSGGEVYHIHPATWVVPLNLTDMRGIQRSLSKLARQGFIRVLAANTEYHRRAELTEKGKLAVFGPVPPER